MQSRRTAILAASLLLVAAAAGYVHYAQPFQPQPAAATQDKPLPGQGTVSNLRLQPLPSGRWKVSFDYFYTGEKNQWISVRQHVQVPNMTEPQTAHMPHYAPQRGTHTMYVEIDRPQMGSTPMTTTAVSVSLIDVSSPQRRVVSEVKVPQIIEWPDETTFTVDRELASGPAQKVIDRAVALIDTNQTYQLRVARQMLERVVEKQPRTDAAYVELARVAMKTNWSPEGLRQAEALIGSALQIRPDSVNAKILLGYVYAHQKRFKEAQALFVESARENPPNIWLWVNWGELLAMQGKPAAAQEKWQEAVARPPTGDTYDRARQWAYKELIGTLDERKDEVRIEALLKQRAEEYGSTGCFRVHYARFLAVQRGDAARALELASRVAPSQCAETRDVQGLAHYLAWASGAEPERTDALNRARVMLPAGPRLFYQLASSERTVPVARALLAAGESVAAQDNEQLDALTYALRNRETQIAGRLLKLGARPDARIGPQRMPAALIPVLMRDFDGIRLMQRAGVDYSKLRFQGETALDHARQQGDRKLLEAVDPRAGAL